MRPPRADNRPAPGPVRRVLEHEVRLIGGQWKRSKLPVADVPGLRPTPDRVRETLFNWLGQDLTGWRCLDAFAGSGALGFEAASRGAAEVVLLERQLALVHSLRASQQRLGATALRIEQANALPWLARCPRERFDLIFLDPPFDSALALRAVDAARPLLRLGGLIYLEHSKPWADDVHGLTLHRQARAGAVHYHLLRGYTDPAAAPSLPERPPP